jgi:excinuclease ABC subunit A
MEQECIEVIGARENNLKDVHAIIPRNQLVVITGLSGSGKSSLAFNTLYAEGQRRYIETFGTYARQFLGEMQRPDVDKINGLSPVISIEQKTGSKNPRSTVGTITEIYDFLRLVFAKAADAYSPITGEKMVKFSEEQIISAVQNQFNKKRIILLAPLVKARKGHYRELFESLTKQGYLRVRVDGKIIEISKGLKLDRYKIHDIELVVDKVDITAQADHSKSHERIKTSIQTTLKLGKGNMMVLQEGNETKNQKPIYFSKNLVCMHSGISLPEPEPNLFSFNSPYGACNHCSGLGKISSVSIENILPNPGKSIRNGGLAPLGNYKNNWTFNTIEALLQKHGYSLDTTSGELSDDCIGKLLYGSEERIEVRFQHAKYSIKFEGIISLLERQQTDANDGQIDPTLQSFYQKIECNVCNGTRLKSEALNFKLASATIHELGEMNLNQLGQWFGGVEKKLNPKQQIIAQEPLKEISSRLQFLIDVGLGYLTLNRTSVSLSGGEAQRIRLATQIGSRLVGVLYILDEPSIGLHPRDNRKLIQSLQNLRDLGNTVMVVEHDLEMMQQCDHLIDIGPGAGVHGGRIVAQGKPQEISSTESTTAQYLRGEIQIDTPVERRKGNKKFIRLDGARGHNLKNVNLKLPLGKLVCVTGVSGSGKSSLIEHTLYPALIADKVNFPPIPLPFKKISGTEHVNKIIEIDQSPIGRTPRSNPATYTSIFTDIRNLFAALPEAKVRGYMPGRFSFNVAGGRCETCKGGGVRTIEMNFLPDVHVTCETCNGKRYNRETLEIRYRGKSISDVLQLTVDQAIEFFEPFPKIKHVIKTLQDVGLGYITLGQHSTTLSGGEAQRIKLASELGRRDTGDTLYFLDEPTTGLHFQDVQMLINVLNRLADRGNSVVVIEHNIDIMKVSDHIIDIGPEGGEAGGQIIAEGTPEEIALVKESYTGKFLAEEFNSKKKTPLKKRKSKA